MRTVRVMLDANTYQVRSHVSSNPFHRKLLTYPLRKLKLDQTRQASENSRDVYETFNVILRRRPKENNFKAVLETIRDLMRSELVVPDWLHDVFLGKVSGLSIIIALRSPLRAIINRTERVALIRLWGHR